MRIADVLDLRYYSGYTLRVKTAVSLPDPLFKAADRLARKMKIPRSRLYARAIEEYVAKAEESDITARLNEIYSEQQSELDPVIAAMQFASMPYEKW